LAILLLLLLLLLRCYLLIVGRDPNADEAQGKDATFMTLSVNQGKFSEEITPIKRLQALNIADWRSDLHRQISCFAPFLLALYAFSIVASAYRKRNNAARI
jgi:hypothetical protein